MAKFSENRGPGRFLVPAAVAALYLIVSVTMVWHALRTPKVSHHIVQGDSEAYLAIARNFARGDFSMSDVRHWPHRQPLYPLLLAVPLKLSGENLCGLVLVNVVVGLGLVLSVYGGVRHCFGDPLIAGLVALCVPINRFLMDFIPRHLVTEPLFVLLVFWAVVSFLDYLREGRSVRLFTASAACGLAYLTRPNGLFIMAAMLGTLFCRDLWLLVQNHRFPAQKPSGQPSQRLFNYTLSTVIFIVLTAPSWVPRWRLLGNPISHGYVSNYLYVDDYDQGHNQTRARYRFSDYTAHHHALDVVKRIWHGLWQVYLRVPLWSEEWAVLYLLGVAGFCLIWKKGPADFRWLALWMFIELLPLVWTNLPNPTGRIPYAAMLPFLFIFAAMGLHALRNKFTPATLAHG